MKVIYLLTIAFLVFCTIIVADFIESPFKRDPECPDPDTCPPTFLPDPKNCKDFFECLDGRKLRRHCPDGLEFSKKWHGCVEPGKSDCNPPPNCTEGTQRKHECNCTQYYLCQDEKWVYLDCPKGYHFDNTRNETCVIGLKCTGSMPQCINGEKLPHENLNECKKYYLCIEGRKVLRNCSESEHFDKIELNCVDGEKCGPQPPRETCKNGEMKGIGKTVCESEYKKYCGIYYKCEDEDWIQHKCSNNEHFNPEEEKCVSGGCESRYY